MQLEEDLTIASLILKTLSKLVDFKCIFRVSKYNNFNIEILIEDKIRKKTNNDYFGVFIHNFCNVSAIKYIIYYQLVSSI